MVVVLVALVVLIVLGLTEGELHRRNVKSVPIRILVNGTRGKTTVSRVIAAGLNEKGIKTLCRTTGSEAETIYPDGKVEPFVRKRGASILEMKKIFRMAREAGAQAVVVECMALHEENQRAMRDILVCPTHVVITNSFIDHVAEMGPTTEDTVSALFSSVPKEANLYVTEDHYEGQSRRVVKAEPWTVDFDSPIPLHPSSAGIARAVLNDFGVDEETLRKGIGRILPDIGLYGNIMGKNGSILVPTFSINDLECMKSQVKETSRCFPDREIYLVFNNRKDREYRIQLFREVAVEHNGIIKGVYVIGDYTWKVQQYLKLGKVNAERSTPELLLQKLREEENLVLVGLGNIKGAGETLVSRALEEN